MNWNSTIQDLLIRVVDWVTRARHVSRMLLVPGAAILLATLGSGWTLGVSGTAGVVRYRGWLSTGEGLPFWLICVAFALAVVLLLAGATMLVRDHVQDSRRASRSAVIALELRGLVDTSDQPLLASVPRKLPGQRIDALIDIRAEVAAKNNQRAFAKVSDVADVVRRLRGAREKRDVVLLAGGVLQVPFLFYAGVLLDDEGEVTPMDWDRVRQCWRSLDAPDDGERFIVEGASGLPPDAQHVVLTVSASYMTDAQAVAATFGTTPIVSLALPQPLPDTLWSEAKQAALARQFLHVLAELGNRGVKSIALILAAPSSLALRMGRAYDRRNLPKISCYHYHRDASPPYPWSVGITVDHAQLESS